MSLVLAASGTTRVTFSLPGDGTSQSSIDGELTSAARWLEAGDVVRIETESRVRVALRPAQAEAGVRLIFNPAELRHLWLGDYEDVRFETGGRRLALLTARSVTVSGPVDVTTSSPEGITVRVDGADVEGTRRTGLELAADVRVEPPAVVRRPIVDRGGPVLFAGVRAPLQPGVERFALRAAYEVAIADYVFASLAFETDFDSIMESFVVEVATPGLLYIVPSATVGVGAVARQLGSRPADAAIRFRGGLNYHLLGGGVDVDYWPALGQWTTTMFLRLSV